MGLKLQFYKGWMNKYEVTGVIDEGAYGIVMKALNRTTKHWVAIKRFKDTDEDDLVYRNIQREIQMLKTFKSEYVVDLKEAFRKKGRVYLIFEFMQKNLLNVIEEHEQGLPKKLVSQLVYRIVRAVYYLHSHNVIHRDIKPQNLLINQDPELELKICDFGFTRILSLHKMTEYVATRWYRSPELLVGEKYGKEIDMWAVGCIMGEMLNGQPMFPGENELDQIFLLKKTFGTLTQSQEHLLRTSKRFQGMKIADVKIREPLEMKYVNKIEKAELSFLKGCLKTEPSERLTAIEALRHPYLKEYSEKELSLLQEQSHMISLRKKSNPQFMSVPKHPDIDKNPSFSGKKFSLQSMFSKELGKPSNPYQLHSQRKLIEESTDSLSKGETLSILPKLVGQKSTSLNRNQFKANSLELKIGKIKTIYNGAFHSKLRQSKEKHMMRRK